MQEGILFFLLQSKSSLDVERLQSVPSVQTGAVSFLLGHVARIKIDVLLFKNEDFFNGSFYNS